MPPTFPTRRQVITLDTAGANYRSVWAMHKHFPHVKTFVRAFDIENGGRRGLGGRHLSAESAGWQGASCSVPASFPPRTIHLPPLLLRPSGVMLERAGATAVVPEILEPSLQLAAAVLSQVGWLGGAWQSLVTAAAPQRRSMRAVCGGGALACQT